MNENILICCEHQNFLISFQMKTFFLKTKSSFFFIKSYQLSESGVYSVPLLPNRVNSLEAIAAMPLTPSPEVFGLHENADITKNFNETNNVRDFSGLGTSQKNLETRGNFIFSLAPFIVYLKTPQTLKQKFQEVPNPVFMTFMFLHRFMNSFFSWFKVFSWRKLN